MKLAYVAVYVLLQNVAQIHQYLNIISIVLLLFTLLTALMRLMMVPKFNKTVNSIENLSNWATVVVSFIIVINTFDTSIDKLNLYYIAILSPFLLGVSFLIEYHWQNRIVSRIRGD